MPKITDVSTLLIHLVPGFLAFQLYKAFYITKPRSQFEDIIWSVINSFFIRLAIEVVNLCTEFEFALTSLGPISILTALVGGLLWGGVLIGARWLWLHIPFSPDPDHLAIWVSIASKVNKEALWFDVRTKLGVHYVGWLAEYSFNPSFEDHEYLLKPAYAVEDNLSVIRNIEDGGVYLNTRDVESVEMIPGRPI